MLVLSCPSLSPPQHNLSPPRRSCRGAMGQPHNLQFIPARSTGRSGGVLRVGAGWRWGGVSPMVSPSLPQFPFSHPPGAGFSCRVGGRSTPGCWGWGGAELPPKCYDSSAPLLPPPFFPPQGKYSKRKSRFKRSDGSTSSDTTSNSFVRQVGAGGAQLSWGGPACPWHPLCPPILSWGPRFAPTPGLGGARALQWLSAPRPRSALRWVLGGINSPILT